MAMKKMAPAASPDAYEAALTGWRQRCVQQLRKAARAVRGLEEVIKWGNLVYLHDGPVLVIRAEDERVLLGFWRGARLRGIEPRLKPGGKYEMATMEFHQGDEPDPRVVGKLVRSALELARELGDPALAAAPRKTAARVRRKQE